MNMTNNNFPLVTVYMPTYNRVDLLQRAVDSVLKQDYSNIELIVVDDNSSDGTHEYLAKMADKHPRFKYFINDTNSGACVSRNKAIFEADGEFITGLDDDDYFLPYHISTLLDKWYKKGNNCIAVYPNSYIKSIDSVVKSRMRPTQCRSKDLICLNWIGNQIFTKTQFLKDINGFDNNFPAWQDLECWYRLLSTNDATAECSNKYTYTSDVSHPHERITNSKLSVIVEAYNIFCEKYNLNYNQREILATQLLSYNKESACIKSALRIALYSKRKHNIDRAVRLLASTIKTHLKKLTNS